MNDSAEPTDLTEPTAGDGFSALGPPVPTPAAELLLLDALRQAVSAVIGLAQRDADVGFLLIGTDVWRLLVEAEAMSRQQTPEDLTLHLMQSRQPPNHRATGRFGRMAALTTDLLSENQMLRQAIERANPETGDSLSTMAGALAGELEARGLGTGWHPTPPLTLPWSGESVE